MAYKLGVVGIGHWFERLYVGMIKTNAIELSKIASASGIEKKREQIAKLGIPEERYYKISGAALPNEFFEDIDVLHISDPNEFHAEQTLQSLSKGIATITEKTWGVNREEFENVVSYIKENGLEEKSYLHLHYVHKLLTIELPELLKKFTERHGKVAGSSATFFEVASLAEQTKRQWLFMQKNGGLFMDWIHPFEVYYRGSSATKTSLDDVAIYSVNEKYSTENPTGVYARVSLDGEFFKRGAKAHIRIAKGVEVGQQKESMRFLFDSGNYLNLNFVHSEVEYTSDMRGTWELYDGNTGMVIDSGAPKGPTSSDILVNDILWLCKGKNLGLTLHDVSFIFETQWKYQELVKGNELIRGSGGVDGFIKDGLSNAI